MIGAQISIYPLKEKTVSETLSLFWEELDKRGIKYEINSFSTIVWMEDEELFNFLKEIYNKLKNKKIVIVTTISNACPKIP